jgi:3'-5' exoribonuclease
MSTSDRRPHRDIATLRAGEQIDDEIYLVAQKDLRTTANGGLYIHAVLADRTGQLVSRMWNATQALYDSMVEGGLIHVRGRVENYKGNLQCIIDGLRSVEPGSADPADFLPRSRHDIEKMWARVLEILRTVRHPYMRALIAKFVKDESFVANFKLAPAARTNHHAWLGGLLEHTLNLLEVALMVLPRYPDVSSDLVLTGLFLHDAGKTAELAYRTHFEYTNEGQLLGHLVQVTLWVNEKSREIERETGRPFPAEPLQALLHILVAHHGRYEFGSPKLPATPEAIMVHYLDNLDAKLNMMFQAIETDNDASSDWTGWVSALETKVFKPNVLGTPGDGASGDQPESKK